MNAEAVAEATKHADDAHRLGFAHSAEIIEVGDVESLVEAAFDAPGRTIVLKPLGGAEFSGQETGHQGDDFRLVVAQVAAQQGHRLDTGKIDGFGSGGLGTQHSEFGLAFIYLTLARQAGGCLSRGKIPPEGR